MGYGFSTYEDGTGSSVAGHDDSGAAGLADAVGKWAGVDLVGEHGGGRESEESGGRFVEAHGGAADSVSKGGAGTLKDWHIQAVCFDFDGFCV